MPVIRNNHPTRARFGRAMADLSASNIERIVHMKLADLDSSAGDALPGDVVRSGMVV